MNIPGLYEGPFENGKPTWSGYGRNIPVGWVVRRGSDEEWMLIEPEIDVWYQCRPDVLPDPELPGDPETVVTTIGTMKDRPDHADWLWLAEGGQWLPMTAYPFRARSLENLPIRVKRRAE